MFEAQVCEHTALDLTADRFLWLQFYIGNVQFVEGEYYSNFQIDVVRKIPTEPFRVLVSSEFRLRSEEVIDPSPTATVTDRCRDRNDRCIATALPKGDEHEGDTGRQLETTVIWNGRLVENS